MTRPVNSQSLYTPEILELSYKNCNKLVEFLAEYRGSKNDKSGKYHVSISTIQNLFNETWKDIPTKSGHKKIQHKITHVIINYQNHDNDPVDPGAVVTIADSLQQHINTFYDKYLGYSTRVRHGTKPDFMSISKRLNYVNHSNK